MYLNQQLKELFLLQEKRIFFLSGTSRIASTVQISYTMAGNINIYRVSHVRLNGPLME